MVSKGGIRLPGHLRPQRGGLVRADRGASAGAGFGRHAAGLALPLAPAGDRAGADAEEAGGLGVTEAGVDGAQQPLAEVDRLLLHLRSLASAQLKCNPL